MIEISRFRLHGSADETAFLGADSRVQSEFSYQQPGLLRRTTAKGSDGAWVVVTVWDSAASADAAGAASVGDPACRELDGFVDPSSMRTDRFVERD